MRGEPKTCRFRRSLEPLPPNQLLWVQRQTKLFVHFAQDRLFRRFAHLASAPRKIQVSRPRDRRDVITTNHNKLRADKQKQLCPDKLLQHGHAPFGCSVLCGSLVVNGSKAPNAKPVQRLPSEF